MFPDGGTKDWLCIVPNCLPQQWFRGTSAHRKQKAQEDQERGGTVQLGAQQRGAKAREGGRRRNFFFFIAWRLLRGRESKEERGGRQKFCFPPSFLVKDSGEKPAADRRGRESSSCPPSTMHSRTKKTKNPGLSNVHPAPPSRAKYRMQN